MNQFREKIKEIVKTLIINKSDDKFIGMSDTQLFKHVKKFCSDNCLVIVAQYYDEGIMPNLNRISHDVNAHRKTHAILDMVVDRDDFHNEIVDSVKEKR